MEVSLVQLLPLLQQLLTIILPVFHGTVAEMNMFIFIYLNNF